MMKEKEFLFLLANGWELHVRNVNLTQYRTLVKCVKPDETKKGIPQSLVARLCRNAMLQCDYTVGDLKVWKLSSWGEVLAKNRYR